MAEKPKAISQDTAEAYALLGIPYEGYVEGIGYQSLLAQTLGSCYFQERGCAIPQFEPVMDSSPEMRIQSVGYKHRVKVGETLTSISQYYGVTIASIMTANPSIDWPNDRNNGDLIFAGEVLALPNLGALEVLPKDPSASTCMFPFAPSNEVRGMMERGAANRRGGLSSSKWFKQGADWGEALLRMHNNMPADAYSVAGNIDIVGLLGADMSFPGRLWIASGNDRGMSTNVFDFGVAAGLDVGASVVMTSYYFVGDTNQLKIGDFEGSRWSLSLGLSFIVELGGGFMVAPVPGKGYIIGKSQHIGVSPPGPSGNINWGRTGFY